MSTLLRAVTFALAGTLAMAPAGCDSKKKDRDESKDDDDGRKKKKKDKEDDDDDGDRSGRGLSGDEGRGDEGKKVEGVSPAAGAVLEYMPADCAGGRFYVNTAELFSDGASQGVLREITSKILAKQRDPNASKVVEVLKGSGFDLATGVREIAMCMDASEQPVIGVALTIGDTIAMLNKMAVATGEPAQRVTEKDGAKLISAGDMTFAQPREGVLLLGAPSSVDSALKKRGADGFADARGQVAWAQATIRNEGTVQGKITRAGANFNVWASMRFTGDVVDAMRKDPTAFETEMRKKALEESAGLRGTPYALVDQRAQNATFKVQGDAITVIVSIPAEDITALLKAAAPELGVSVDGSGPAPSASDPLDELLKMMKKK